MLEREEKRTIVLMVVGDAARNGLCSLSLVLVYRRIILLSTELPKVGICCDVQNELPFMISLQGKQSYRTFTNK